MLAEAQTLVNRLEDTGQSGEASGRNACWEAYLAARAAVQALCIHYNQEFTEDTPLDDLFGMLAPSYLRVPPEVQRAQMLSQYATPRAPAGGDCTDAVALAQNVVAWAKVVMDAGKPFIPG
jgi:hypothetical protein